MTAVEVQVGAWSTTATFGNPADWQGDVVLVDSLDAAWRSDVSLFPSQPDPTTLAFSLYVPALPAGPVLAQGDRVEFRILAPGWAAPTPPFFEFCGRVTDLDAEVLRDGIVYRLTAVDHVAEVAEAGVIGDTPWPMERWDVRWASVAAAATAATSLTFDGTRPAVDVDGFGPLIAARDVDAQPIADLVGDLLSDVAIWRQTDVTINNGNLTNPALPMVGPVQRWFRPILCADVDAAGSVVYRLGLVGKGQTSPWALPYRVELDEPGGGGLTLVRKDYPDQAVEAVAWIPSAAVDRRAIAWRQDKARVPNRIRLTGDIVEYDSAIGADRRIQAFVREFSRQVEARGPVEATKQTDAATTTYANSISAAYLGDEFDTVPRWSADSIPVNVDHLAADDTAWPRLFPHRAGHVDPPLGRLVLVTDVDPRWNLADRADHAGRLVGAQLHVAGGRIRLVAEVLPRIPYPNGPDQLLDPTVVEPRPGGCTIAEADALGVTIGGAGALTFADFRLADSPPPAA